jgi:serine/threonine-protein kinase
MQGDGKGPGGKPAGDQEVITVVDPHGVAGDSTWPSEPPSDADAGASRVMRYKLGDVLGRGGMGEVVSARDEQIGRLVAIKRLRADQPTKTAVTRFLREARIQGRLGHPSVVPVHELRHDDRGQPFFVMRQLTGITLSEVIKKLAAGDGEMAKRFPRQRLLRTFTEVCLAIEFAHTRGIVHRDLKPSNIIVGDFGDVYVIDWGIAHVMRDEATGDPTCADFADIHTFDESVMVEGMILGSPGYMSPEQIRVEPDLDGRSDIYALGCILFEILALEPLHESGIAGIALALTGVDARLSLRVPAREVPPELEVICLAATMVERTDRYASARELGDAVQRFLDGDRDVGLRKELAQTELAQARAALARGNGTNERREALRAAARALALDPTNRDPAELVGRLMLEPPKSVPPEVEDAIARSDDDALFAARRLIIQASLAYLAFFPILYVIGFDNVGFLAAGTLIATGMGLLAHFATRDHVKLIAYTGLLGNSLMTLLFSWVATPFLIAPSLGVITAMSIATHPRVARGWVLVTVVATSVLAPFALELLGVLRPSTIVSGNTLVLHAVTSGLERTTTTMTLVLYVIALLSMAVILAKSLTSDRRSAQRLVQIQAWQLRQLMPAA